MARRVFFSFHFGRDNFRVNQVRNCNVVLGTEDAGFYDHSEYEEAEKTGQLAIDRMIREKLKGTTVTVVLIGRQTAGRPWVKRELELSLMQRNGFVGVRIHDLKDREQQPDTRGRDPKLPDDIEFPIFDWDVDDWDGSVRRLAKEIEKAAKRAEALRAKTKL